MHIMNQIPCILKRIGQRPYPFFVRRKFLEAFQGENAFAESGREIRRKTGVRDGAIHSDNRFGT